MAVVLRRAVAVVLGLVSAVILWFLAVVTFSLAETYGNVTEGGVPVLAAFVGVIAAGLGALAASLWKRPRSGKLVATVFVSILVAAGVIFGVVYLNSDQVIIG